MSAGPGTGGATGPAGPAHPTGSPLDAVVLTGGRARRLGGVSKADVDVGGRTLLDRVLDATRVAGARRVVVVGPSAPEGVLSAREDPPFGGPVAGIAAGLTALDTSGDGSPAPAVLVLACDLPFVATAVGPLLRAYAALGADEHGACLLDPGGRLQWLAGAYRRQALDEAVRSMGEVRDAPVRALVAALRLVGVPSAAGADVDTWEAVEAARAAARH